MHSVRKRRRVEEEEEEGVSKNIGMSVTDFCAVTGNVIAVFVHVARAAGRKLTDVIVIYELVAHCLRRMLHRRAADAHSQGVARKVR